MGSIGGESKTFDPTMAGAVLNANGESAPNGKEAPADTTQQTASGAGTGVSKQGATPVTPNETSPQVWFETEVPADK